jgi:ADP-heptose:LPS heptosyltransferase
LNKSGITTKHTLKPDFSWATTNVDRITNKYFNKKFILLFPFCSPQLSHKKWAYFNDLIKIIKNNHANLEIVIAPGPDELESSKEIDATSITNKDQSINLMELAGLISKSSYVIANDTGPAHMAAHLGKMGIVLFGHHTTPKKVSIETDKFKAITSAKLENLTAEKVYQEIREKIESIN